MLELAVGVWSSEVAVEACHRSEATFILDGGCYQSWVSEVVIRTCCQVGHQGWPVGGVIETLGGRK